MNSPCDKLCHAVIMDYLMHSCYKETAKAFDSEYKKQSQFFITTPWPNTDAMEIDIPIDENGMLMNEQAWLILDARKDIYEAIERGDIPTAFDLIQRRFPGLLQHISNRNDVVNVDGLTENEKIWADRVVFKLKCQQFIETVRSSNEVEAIRYAQQNLWPMNEYYQDMITEVAPLIVYTNPEQSSQAYLLSQDCRRQLADEVNDIILAYCKMPKQTAMEMLQKQYQVVQQELQSTKKMYNKFCIRDKRII
ncbi:CTLH/CRA C-terminal to lish motif domain-domain-containing protein [Absidia repens]|uniref:CTLH/CRA C-terminal to lish motif domain-domain-containing protein n=1 Tax=Absidia repens TaxID=90262 RepID=A0A1X2I4S2_9FUNG|nr:CTLH/CRA C-terminal to lish motif domain-domain-containing protein [Absidia repens]